MFRPLSVEGNSDFWRRGVRLQGQDLRDPGLYPFTTKNFLDCFEPHLATGRMLVPLVQGWHLGGEEVPRITQVEWEAENFRDVQHGILLTTLDAGLIDFAQRRSHVAPPYSLPHIEDWTVARYMPSRKRVRLIGDVISGRPGWIVMDHLSGRYLSLDMSKGQRRFRVETGWRWGRSVCNQKVFVSRSAIAVSEYEFRFFDRALMGLRGYLGMPEAPLADIAAEVRERITAVAGFPLLPITVLRDGLHIQARTSDGAVTPFFPLVASLRDMLWDVAQKVAQESALAAAGIAVTPQELG